MLPISLTNALRIAQLETLPMVYGGIATTEIRCRFAQLISEILPGDLNGVLFPLGGAKKRHMAKVRGTQGTTFRKRQRKCVFLFLGAEANETAIRIARRYTGKHKGAY